MQAKRDVSKERYWRRIIRRQGKSGETITHFCAREGVPVHQFHWWKRTLRARDRQSTQELQIADNGDASARQDKQASNSFVPVRLPFLNDAPIEVVHPGGYLVRVPVGFDPPSLRRILATLDRSSSDSGGN